MDTPLQVVWSEGLLMTPQHLQQQDRYSEHLVHTRLGAVSQDSWGVLTLGVDDRALKQGQVTLEAFLGIMPDGLPLELSRTSAALPPARPIDDHFSPTAHSMDVFLAVPRAREGVANVAKERDPRVRWYRSTKSTQDLLGEADQQHVDYAQPSLVLLFGDEQREGYDSIKILEVIRTEAGSYAMSDTYIPPALRLSSSEFLMGGMRRLLSAMTTTRQGLAQAQRERGDAELEYNAADVTRFLFLNVVSTFLPVVDHYAESGDLTPRTLYLTLVQLVGQLSVFSRDFELSSVPKFVYTDLRATFEPLFAIITSLLQTTVQTYFIAIPLEGRDDGMHLGQLQDENVSNCSKFLLGVRSAADETEVRQSLPKLSKIASWQDAQNILSAATPGAKVEVTFRPPSQIPIKAGVTYFIIDTNNQYWQNIMLERRVAVYLPGPFITHETTVELLGVLDEKRGD